jgi:hypothetical protein
MPINDSLAPSPGSRFALATLSPQGRGEESKRRRSAKNKMAGTCPAICVSTFQAVMPRESGASSIRERFRSSRYASDYRIARLRGR